MKKIWIYTAALAVLLALTAGWLLFNNTRGFEKEALRLGGRLDARENESGQQDEAEVTLYFANNEFVTTGDDSLQKVIPVKKTVKYGPVSLEEAAVRELMKDPGVDGLSTGIPQEMELLSVRVEDDIAFVDLANKNLNGGSLQELMTINQIVQTLTEFPNIKKVRFLVDGKQTETLMGHIDTSRPLERQ